MVLFSIFEKQDTFYEYNRGAIAPAVSPQIGSHTLHIAIKYHHFRSFVVNGDIYQTCLHQVTDYGYFYKAGRF